MIHRTYRSLDAPVKLIGFTVRQWAGIILGIGLAIGVVHVTQMPTKVAITICAFVIGIPVTMTYLSEGGGLQLSSLMADMWRWRSRPREFQAGHPTEVAACGIVVELPDGQELASIQDARPVDTAELFSEERWGA